MKNLGLIAVVFAVYAAPVTLLLAIWKLVDIVRWFL